MSSLRFLPISRGTLLKLREKYEIAKRGKEILEMRREQLIREIFFLMNKLKEREKLERHLIKVLENISKLRVYRGEEEFKSMIALVKPPQMDVILMNVQGVSVPQVKILEEPKVTEISDIEFRSVFEKLWRIFRSLLEIANIERSIEELSKHLSYINRVVNNLEKKLLPELRDMISYMEERLDEEMISEFVRLRKLSGED